MKNVVVLPPIKSHLRAALLNIAAFREIPTEQLIVAARALPSGAKVHLPDRATTIAFLLGTQSVDLS